MLSRGKKIQCHTTQFFQTLIIIRTKKKCTNILLLIDNVKKWGILDMSYIGPKWTELNYKEVGSLYSTHNDNACYVLLQPHVHNVIIIL